MTRCQCYSVQAFAFAALLAAPIACRGAAPVEASLPAGVNVVWDLSKAHREATPTREQICLNGLWRWQPAADSASAVPADGWGFYKVPGFWPGRSSYIQEDCQTLYAHPSWDASRARTTTAAWYQRELTVPKEWTGRRILLRAEFVNSLATVYVDGQKAGEIRYPAGVADVTDLCRPGSKQVVSLHVQALPLRAVLLSYNDTNSARSVRGSVDRRGLCGDVYLVGKPASARIADVKIDTSVRKGELAVSPLLEGLRAKQSYTLRVKIRQGDQTVREFASKPFTSADLQDGRIAVTEKWQPAKLWDVHMPQNMLLAEITLADSVGNTADVFHPIRFGFREFWIDGRDFYLNGSRIHLAALPIDNAQIGARTATYEWCRETMRRFRSIGINFLYTHNYGCEPGSHASFEELLRAADDEGMLLAFSQPHFGHYDWKAPDADRSNGYARHAEFYVRVAQNHPSVVAYSMSHNATGYNEDMNPDRIDGIKDPREDQWSQNNAKLALRAEAIVKRLDPGRIAYHHSSGNLSSMHTINFYVNFVPIQELSDWFEHWATVGVKPVFPVEYGVPFTWDWTMYRGWYKGVRNFGSAVVPWEFCVAEWNAQFFGAGAYRISEAEKRNLRWEAGRFRTGSLWHRWDYPHQVGTPVFDDQQAVIARYITDNWRAHRTWGISATSPWECGAYWRLRDGADRKREELKVDWDNVQKPGFSPDYAAPRSGHIFTDRAREDWVPTAAAKAVIRNNRPLLAYLGGKPARFTSKDHNFFPGETVEKQLIVINDSRETVACEGEWKLNLPQPAAGACNVSVRPGEQERVPLRVPLPSTLPAGTYELAATFQFGTGETQSDSFTIHVLPSPAASSPDMKIALWDPKGETNKLLTDLKVRFTPVESNADLRNFDLLIIGKKAFTVEGSGPDVSRVRDGLKVIVFEQVAKVLEQRFGFRVTEYGLRQAFPRVPDHPLLAGLDANHLHDWRGEATLLPPRLEYTTRPRHGPTVHWCGIDVTRVWRCGCRGNVASVLIEKPACGDFLSILDGGYALQYSPLLEYREGNGVVLFCQVDVTGRSEGEPAAEILTRNILAHIATWKAMPKRKALYAGEAAGKRHLEAAGFHMSDFSSDDLTADHVLIVGPGAGRKLSAAAEKLGRWRAAGGRMLGVGLDDADAAALFASKISLKKAEHIAAYFDAPSAKSYLAGISPADVHNRDPREIPLVAGGAAVVGNGVLATGERDQLVLCQLAPWQFDAAKAMNLKRTFRRTSVLLSRLAANVGAAASTPILSRFATPVAAGKAENRWLTGLYLDVPEEWDDPYRFFRW